MEKEKGKKKKREKGRKAKRGREVIHELRGGGEVLEKQAKRGGGRKTGE